MAHGPGSVRIFTDPCHWYAVLRIHDILVWIRIRIRGSMPLHNGSGFGSGFGSGSWIRILLFSSLTFKTPTKTNLKNKFLWLLLLHLHNFSKVKVQKKSQNSGNQSFSYYFCLMIEGSGRPKNMWIRWIRIRIRNTGPDQIRHQNTPTHADPSQNPIQTHRKIRGDGEERGERATRARSPTGCLMSGQTQAVWDYSPLQSEKKYQAKCS